MTDGGQLMNENAERMEKESGSMRKKSKSGRSRGNVTKTLKLCYFLMCNTGVIFLLLSYLLGLHTAFSTVF